MKLKFDTKKIEKWDKRFSKLAKFTAEWSKDPSSKVGAVIVNKHNGVVGLGYNGFPRGVEDSIERLENKPKKNDIVIHAEQNALLNAGDRAKGATIYVWGKPICSSCAGLIIQSGIKRVVALNPSIENKDSQWYRKGQLSLEMFKEAGIKVDLYKTKD